MGEHEIAVVGMAGRFPGAGSVRELWRNLQGGVESLTFWSDEELLEAGVDPAQLEDPNYVKACFYLSGQGDFDAGFFEMNPREAELTDPQQRIFLECAWEALEDAGIDPARYPGSVGVFAGSALWWLILCSSSWVFRRRISYGSMIWINKISGGVIVAFGVLVLLTLTTFGSELIGATGLEI